MASRRSGAAPVSPATGPRPPTVPPVDLRLGIIPPHRFSGAFAGKANADGVNDLEFVVTPLPTFNVTDEQGADLPYSIDSLYGTVTVTLPAALGNGETSVIKFLGAGDPDGAGREARAVVHDRHHDAVAEVRQVHADVPALGRELRRVGQEVDEDLPEQRRIRLQHRRLEEC